MKIGYGYDVHKLIKGRKLILGGVEIPNKYGLDGHSDADVLIHAIIDALLGAAGLGDIGLLFPDTDKAYKDISSLILLEKTGKLVPGIVNIDSTVIAQGPKLSPWREAMCENIAQALKIDKTLINVKFTTEEGLGFTGSGEGIAANAAVLIK